MHWSKAIIGCSSAITIFFCTEAYSQNVDCVSGLKPDVTTIKQDYAASYSYLQTINSSNYEEHKKNGNAGAQIVDVPATASYSEFDAARSAYFQKFDIESRTRIKTDAMFTGFSEEAYKAYAECIHAMSDAPIAAWVSKFNSDLIIVTIKTYIPNSFKATLKVLGADPLNQPMAFNGPGEQKLMFSRPKDGSFLAAFQLIAADNTPMKAADVELPQEVHLKLVREEKILHQKVHCGAGCHGSTTGCQNVENVNITPDKEGAYLTGSIHYDLIENTGIAGVDRHEDFTKDHARTAFVCEANQGKAQQFITYDASVLQVYEKVVPY